MPSKVLVLVPSSRMMGNFPRDLVYGCWCAGKRVGDISFPPLTSVLVATILRSAGIDAEFRDLAAEGLPMEVLDDHIRDYFALVILTSTMTINEDAENLARLKRINPSLFTLAWGSHPTFLPRQTLSKGGIDAAVRREGDYIIRDVILKHFNGEDWRQVPGISYLTGGEYVANPDYPFIENLDELPFPERGMLSPAATYFNPVVKRQPYTTIYTTRGCPGRCTYCTAPPFYGGKVRMRSAQSVISELSVIKDMGYKEVFIRDEIFTASKKRLLEITRSMIDSRLNLAWICSARVGSVDEEMLAQMKAAGCHMIRIGAESGVQEVLDKVKKGIRVEQTAELVGLARKYGIGVHAHMMLGMPGDTSATVRKTVEFAQKINPTVVTFGICTPYPGTQLFEEVLKAHPDIGDGSDCNISKLHLQGHFNSVYCGLTPEELAVAVRDAYQKFYLRPCYVIERLSKISTFAELKYTVLAGLKVVTFSLLGKRHDSK